MLKYLWTVTQDLFVPVTLITWLHAILFRLYGKYGRRFHAVGIGLGVLASAALALAKQTTNKIIYSHWNHYIFACISVFSIILIICILIFGKREGQERNVGRFLTNFFAAALTAALLLLSLPEVVRYPFNFNTMGQGYLSSYYALRLLGWLLALILLVVYSRLLYLCALNIQPFRTLSGLMCGGIAVQLFYSIGRFFAPWVTRAKWLNWPVSYSKEKYPLIGNWLSITVNHSMLFIWLIVILAAVTMVICFAQNVRVKEPWDNPAQHRKLRARNRGHRRIACSALASILVFTLFLTVVKGYDTRVIELSAPETYTVDGDRILVPMESVNDFHLHRFEYKTENDVNVRWIVVRKPNSAAYGVGLDACEVCGNAGYYERNGLVVCRRCDVVMNTSTIGFKGGCNPIPMSYEVENGNLVFALTDIIAGEKEFK